MILLKGLQVSPQFIKGGTKLFEYQPPDDYDIIISNPPFSKKDKILARLYELGKPFAMLLPVTALQAKGRYHLFKRGLELLVFDGRIDYHTRGNFEESKSGSLNAR